MSGSQSESPSGSYVEEDDQFADPPSKRRKTGSSSTQRQQREIGVMRNSLGPSSASFIGSASGIHFVRSVYGAIAESAAARETHIGTPESDTVPGEDDRLHQQPANAASRFLWRDDEVDSHWDHQGGVDFTFDDLLLWTSSYFDNWHPAFPFLHAPSVLQHLEQFPHRDIAEITATAWADLSIVRAIMSISLADARQTRISGRKRVPGFLVFESFEAATQSIQATLSCPATIRSLQAVVSVQLFLVSMLRHNGASRLGGLIVRMAFQLGLHRCPARFQSFSVDETQLRQRLFWSIYCLDRHLCQSLGLPLTIRDDDVDVCYPDNEKHLHGSCDKPEFDERLRLLTYLAKHAEIRGLIMELRNKSMMHSKKDSDQAVVINTKIIKWWNDIEDFLDDDETSVNHLHKIILTVLRQESVIALNRPLLASSRRAPSYGAALQACIEASKSIIATLHRLKPKHASDLNTTSHGTEVLAFPLLWPSFTWAVWMSSFIMVYAAAGGQVATKVAIRCTQRTLETLRHLSSRGSIWPNACAAAIRNLQEALSRREADASSGHHSANLESPDSSAKRNQIDRNEQHRSASGKSAHPRTQEGDLKQPQSSWTASQPPTTGTKAGHTTSLNHNGQLPAFQNVIGSGQAFLNESASMMPNTGSFVIANLEPIPIAEASNDNLMFQDSEHMMNATMDSNDPFYGFDIPFWMNQDTYADLPKIWT